ncbi:MAG: hypothetical protein HY726_13165 [Candidatus Rokubacteria bacterium]|nr:hypothetical protein [Candidatus Rokubacteria bacterium]
MTPQPIESQAIAKVAENYRRRGYDVAVMPRGPNLPEFLAGYQPDIIARSPNESVVIEVKVGTQMSVAERFREIAERVNRQPGWRFSLVYVSPSEPDQLTEAEPAPLPDLQERARDADSLLQAGQPEAAFLLFWSVLEGSLRLLGRRAQLPLENLPSSALIRELYSTGEISRDHFDTLMRLLPIRNRLVHGLLGRAEDVNVQPLRGLVNTLLEDARSV